jgi:hypothetical protein
MRVKLSKNQLKELIRQSIREIDFKNQAAFDAYNKKHKMRKSTKVKIGGKDTTAGDAEKKGTSKKKEKMVRNAAGDMVPANTVAGHPDFKKDNKPDPGERDDSVRKDQKGGFNDTQDFLTGKNAEDNIEKLNDLAADDNPVQFDTDSGQSLTWDDGDMDNGTVLAYDQDGGEVEVDFSDIVRLNADIPRADRGNKALFSDPDDDSGGPSYSNVPKGAKSTKQAKLMKKNDSTAKNLGYKDTKDLVMDGSADDLGEFLDSIPDEGQNFNEADEMINYIRDNEMGERDDDDDVVDGYRKAFLSMVNKPGEKGGSGKSGKDIEKQSMKAADDANTKMDKAELDSAYKQFEKNKKEINAIDYHPIQNPDKKLKKKRDDLMKKQKDYYKNVVRPLEKKVYGESIEEFKQKRFTVKEVHKWMKTLEENRYKKVYNADARRVSWMCNNIGENVVNMPKSMRKKWSKAQYGRERYLAKEFLKSQKKKMMESLKSQFLIEQKLRNSIRRIIVEAKRRELEIHVRDKNKVDKILKKLRLKPGKDYDIGFGSSRSFMLDINVKYLDKVVAILMKNRINVK